MKIAYSLGSIGNSGGIERVISTKANYFADNLGYEVHVIVRGKRPTSLFYHFSDKIHFHYLDISSGKRSLWNHFFPSKEDKLYKQKLESLLFQIKPDITISTFGRDASFLYKLKDGSKKVLEFHFTKNYLKHLSDSLENDRLRWIRKYWLKFLLWKEEQIANHYQHIVVLTECDKQLWRGGDRFTAIPNPLSFQTEETAPLNTKTILSMGRLVYPKGFQYLIRAFHKIAWEFPDWHIVIYGEGHDREKLQNEINVLSLQGQIVLKAPDPDVKSLMMRAGLFVLPTLYDGFGLVLTEAMICGVPCISFDSECGPGEIIRTGEDGFLIPPKNIDALAERMKFLMNNQELRIRMGQKAKENVQRFSITHVGKAWQNYFESIRIHS